MKGSDSNFFQFMVGKDHYIIPLYQRAYSWGHDQCATLYNDMLALHDKLQSNTDLSYNFSHFLGSVVYQNSNDPRQPGIFLIDGQQRVITMYLFYLALYRAALDCGGPDAAFAPKLELTHLSNAQGKHRFTLSTQEDQVAMDKLFAGNKDEYLTDSHITNNFNYFYQHLKSEQKMTLTDFYNITQRLSFVEIALDREDDAQVIFESVNSKGLPLSHGEKVKNFILMGISQDQAQLSYSEHWAPMERNCKEAQGESGLDNFIYHYIAIKRANLPEFGKLYDEFKSFHLRCLQEKQPLADKVLLAAEMHKYSELFKSVKTCKYVLLPSDHDEDGTLQAEIELGLKRLSYMPYERHIPFLMQTMWLQRQHEISVAELIETINLLEMFYIRRWTCEVPTNTLNRFFASLHSQINSLSDEEAGSGFINKLKYVLRTDAARLPNDTRFRFCLENSDFYGEYDLIYYLFERLDSHGQREIVPIMDKRAKNSKAFTVEHIMPQTLTDDWREELGPNAQELYETWLNRLGNLTITAYNSKLSNKTFAEKRDMPNGYRDSALHLNKDIAKHEHWREEDLKQRAEELATKALQIWPYPEA